MSSCEIVTRCLSGSTFSTLPFRSYRFAFALLLHATPNRRERLTTKLSNSETVFVLFRGFISVGEFRCRVFGRSSSSPSPCKRNPSSAKNQSPERTDLLRSSASVRSNARYYQRRRYTNPRPPAADSETAGTNPRDAASQTGSPYPRCKDRPG